MQKKLVVSSTVFINYVKLVLFVGCFPFTLYEQEIKEKYSPACNFYLQERCVILHFKLTRMLVSEKQALLKQLLFSHMLNIHQIINNTKYSIVQKRFSQSTQQFIRQPLLVLPIKILLYLITKSLMSLIVI